MQKNNAYEELSVHERSLYTEYSNPPVNRSRKHNVLQAELSVPTYAPHIRCGPSNAAGPQTLHACAARGGCQLLACVSKRRAGTCVRGTPTHDSPQRELHPVLRVRACEQPLPDPHCCVPVRVRRAVPRGVNQKRGAFGLFIAVCIRVGRGANFDTFSRTTPSRNFPLVSHSFLML
jgi:hypothetical protein